MAMEAHLLAVPPCYESSLEHVSYHTLPSSRIQIQYSDSTVSINLYFDTSALTI